MNQKLMREFEEFEGLGNQVVDESIVVDVSEEDDPSFRPTQAAALGSNEIYYEMDKRNLKTTGFPDTDREILQKVFDEEFKNDLEHMKAQRREKQRKAAHQLGLQKRRMLMEKTLQEEQDELAKNHQIGLMIELVKDNRISPAVRLEINSISARSLAKAMWVNENITCLDLSSNDLNDHAGSYLARILKNNASLRKIELDNNKLGSKSLLAFGESLGSNSSLTYLSLDSNPLMNFQDSTGMRALSDALRVNRVLTSLNLWRTGITAAGGTILASGIEQNDRLIFCDIGHNNIEISDVRRIVDKLDANLNHYEKSERSRRIQAVEEAARLKQHNDNLEDERKNGELSTWLQERRDQRAEARRMSERDRILKMQEELEERKRLVEMRKEEERKAAEEAAAKKAKKKGGDKKKK